MSQSDEVNQDRDVFRGTQFQCPSQVNLNTHTPNLPHDQLPFPTPGFYPTWQPNSTIQFPQHQIPSQFTYNQPHTDVPYFSQPIRPEPYRNLPYFHQNIQSPHNPMTRPLGGPPFSQEAIPLTQPLGDPPVSQRTNKNWSKVEDLQLTIAYDRIMTDPAVGNNQKKSKLWERVLNLFVELMETNHGVKPENNVKTASACENRTNKIKSQCSRWTAVRSRVFAQERSGWSPADYEKLCYEMHEAEGKGAFKWEECWKVLKENPKWHDLCNKKSQHNSRSTMGSQVRKPLNSTDPSIENGVPIDLTTDTIETQTPVTPRNETACPVTEAGISTQGTCTPTLDGHASIDTKRPIGTKKAKGNQRQRKIRKFSESQSSTAQTFNVGQSSMQSETNARWEKLEEESRMKELKEEERYSDLRRQQTLEHEMKVSAKRSELAEKMEVIGKKLLDAIHLLDQMDPTPLVTNLQKMTYDMRKRSVEKYQEAYDGLVGMLDKLKYVSLISAPSQDFFASARISQRRLFEEDDDV